MENNLTVVVYIKNEILYGRCSGAPILDLSSAKLLLKTIKNVSDKKPYPVIIDFDGIKYMDKETREFFFKKSAESFSLLAFVTKDFKFKMLLNSATSIHLPHLLFKVFDTSKKAEVWVKQFTSKK